ncbi:MAG TPA: polymer-forming cytoskeletal protein [Thermomicrobiales bacterium]|nr:polymer-forming cytoskeletal protein [Thermomicrobiales bacterium]
MPVSTIPADSPQAPRRLGLVASALILVFAVIALPTLGFASETLTGDDIAIDVGERIADDLYVAARTFEFAGAATGDVSVAASTATIDGTIDGTVMVAAGTADIDGDIGGSLRILGGSVRITGSVEGDVLLVGGRLELTGSGTIGGSLMMLGGDATVNGTVEGDVRGWVGDLTVGGTVQGEVDVRTSAFNIHNTARITGPVTYSSRTEANIHDNAEVPAGVTRNSLDPWGSGDHVFGRASGSLLRTLWGLVAGALLIAVAPRLANALGSNAKRFLPALPFGLAALILTPIVAILLMTTIIGIPAGLIVVFLYLLALYLTQVFAGMAIGRFILPNGWNDGSRGFHLLAMTIGVILLGALRFIPLPYVHGLVTLVVTIWGMGAVAMLVVSLGRRDRPALAA